MKHSLKAAGVGAALFASIAMAGCGSGASSSSSSSSAKGSSSTSASAQAASSGKVEVFAAASLKNSGDDLKEAFKKSNPDIEITFDFDGSSGLVRKMEQGATPDVLITADKSTMDNATQNLEELKDVKTEVIATNKLVLVTAEGNPGKINSLDDLKNTDGVVAVCAAEVPCGKLAHQELKAHDITLKNATNESKVTDVSTKVTTGNADAGFMYTTDLADAKKKTNKDLGSIELTDLQNNEYPAAVTKHGSSSEAAQKFAEWLSSDEAQQILKEHGFGSAQ